MDITDAVTTEYVAVNPSTPVSKLRGAFDAETDARVIVVEGDDGFEGVVPQKQLLASHHNPDEQVRTVMREPPRVSPSEDVRETARLMVESELKLLPVFEGSSLRGVVTDRSLLELVRPFLDALDVDDIYTRDLVSVQVDTTVGEVINALLENGISRVPVLENGTSRGMISLDDLVEFTVRKMSREQGGSHEGFDQHGGTGSAANYRTHGGYGERAGDAARLLDLLARDVMSTPAETITADQSLGDATDRMLEMGYSSLVVTSPDVTWPLGIVTTTDILRALTRTEETHIPVQVFNVDLLDDLTREAIAERVEEIDHKHGEMDILEVNVVFHKHEERVRGVPLLLATVRLFTDEGRFAGSGEQYGARAAFGEAADIVEQNVLDEKAREHPRQVARGGRVDTERLVGWWLQP